MDFVNIRNCIIMVLMGVLYIYTVHTGTEILFPTPSSPKYIEILGPEYKKLSEEGKEKAKKENNKKSEEYNSKAKKNKRRRFILALVVNIIMLIAVFLFTLFSLIQSGFLIGIIFSILRTYIDYLGNLSKITQFFSFLTMLIVLLFGIYCMPIRKKKDN